MAAPSLPGFHYDKSKRKYFKILPNHIARPGSKHSIDSVRKDIEDRIRRRRQRKWEERKARGRIAGSAVSKHPLLGGGVGLGREMGGGGAGGARKEAWARGLEQREVLGGESGVGSFRFDAVTGGFVVVMGLGGEGTE